MASRSVGRRAVEPQVGGAQQGGSGRAGPPRGRCPLRRPFRGGVDEQRDTRLQCRGQLGARLGPAGDRRAQPVAQPPDPVLQRAHAAPRCRRTPASGPGPRRAAASRPASPRRRRRARPRRPRGRPTAAAARRRPAPGPARRARRSAAGGCRARRRGCGGRPRRGARRRGPGRRTSRGAGRRPARAAGRRRSVVSGTTNSGAPPRPCCGSISCRCARDVVLGARRHPVEQHGEGGAAVCGGLQDVPGHRVGVAGGGGDEQPEVGGGEQLGRRAGGCAVTTESMSGASRKASPGSSDGEVTSWSVRWSVPAPLVRVSSGSTRVSENQRRSSGWQTSTGERVVGRSTPDGLTCCPDQAVHQRSTCPPRWSRRRR